MGTRWYQKTPVQVAIVIGIFAVVVALIVVRRQTPDIPGTATEVPSGGGKLARQENQSIVSQACQLYRAYILAIRDKNSLAENAKTMNQESRNELIKKLRVMNLASASLVQREHFAAARDSIVKFLSSPPTDAYALGYEKARLSNALLPVLADAQLTGNVASKEGFPEISEIVNSQLRFAKGLLLIAKGFKQDKLKTARIPLRLFIESYAVFDSLYSTKKTRSGLAGAALLALEMENLSNVDGATDFKDLYRALRLAYENPGSDVDQSRPISIMILIANRIKITDSELKEVGAEKLAPVIQKMRELLD